MTLRTPYFLNVSMFCCACTCQRYSFPIRRAGSPLQVSSVPRIANETPAARRTCTSARDLLVAPVDGRRAADEVQPFGVGLLRVRRHAELLRPIAPCFSRLAPGIAGALDVRHRALRLGRRRAFHEREVAPHIDDLVDVLDRHRTRLDACRAGRAGPELFRLRLGEMRGRGDLALGLGEELGAVAQQLVADVENDALRIERLAGRERGAVVRAAAAFRAGVAIEQLLPAQVPERGRAEGLLVLDVLDERQLAARGLLAEEDVRQCGDDVEVLRL